MTIAGILLNTGIFFACEYICNIYRIDFNIELTLQNMSKVAKCQKVLSLNDGLKLIK